MFKIAICDDQKIMCEYLKQKLHEILKKNHISYYIVCYTEAIELLSSTLLFDLILLDIDMPELNGISLAKKIREQSIPSELIFVTILKEYVLDAFEVEAVDYIYKPVDLIRLEKAVKRAIKKRDNEHKKSLFVQTKQFCKTIPLQQIYYIEVINRKIYIHTKDGVVEYYAKLQEVQNQLDERFIKCHRSYIVNIDYLKQYQCNIITMHNGQTVPVSRLRQKEFLQSIMQYMKKGE